MVYGLGERARLPGNALEVIEVRASDGQTLFADVREPETEKRAGVAVLAHAMFARRKEFEEPEGRGLAALFAEAGYVTIAFDFRGHGDSVPRAEDGGASSYDDLVRSDLPAVASCAKGRFPDLPLVVVGHGLGGHVALASQATGALKAEALVLVATNVWMRHFESSRRTWLQKRGLAESLALLARRRGYFPARALGIGTDDASEETLGALLRAARRGRWESDDGRDDYARLTSTVRVPVATLTSLGDVFVCSPECGERMVATARGPRLSLRVTEQDDGAPPPGHMEIVTSGQVREVYRTLLGWLGRELSRAP